MSFCKRCATDVEAVESERGSSTCPYCGSGLSIGSDGDTNGDWTDVARVANLAEAGFLANDLAGQGVDAQIHAVENFSASSGSWSVAYLIRVSPDVAHQAAERIRRHVADDQARRQQPARRTTFEFFNQAAAALHWRPVAIMVLLGAVCFQVGQQFGRPVAGPHAPPRNSLPAAVDAIGRPLLTEPVPGQPRYRLSYHWQRRVWRLDIDTDGDGRFDATQHYPAMSGGW